MRLNYGAGSRTRVDQRVAQQVDAHATYASEAKGANNTHQCIPLSSWELAQVLRAMKGGGEVGSERILRKVRAQFEDSRLGLHANASTRVAFKRRLSLTANVKQR